MFADGIPTSFGFGIAFSMILAFWAIYNIAQNQSSGPFSKAIWTYLVLFVPLLGFVLWLIFGPKSEKK